MPALRLVLAPRRSEALEDGNRDAHHEQIAAMCAMWRLLPHYSKVRSNAIRQAEAVQEMLDSEDCSSCEENCIGKQLNRWIGECASHVTPSDSSDTATSGSHPVPKEIGRLYEYFTHFTHAVRTWGHCLRAGHGTAPGRKAAYLDDVCHQFERLMEAGAADASGDGRALWRVCHSMATVKSITYFSEDSAFALQTFEDCSPSGVRDYLAFRWRIAEALLSSTLSPEQDVCTPVSATLQFFAQAIEAFDNAAWKNVKSFASSKRSMDKYLVDAADYVKKANFLCDQGFAWCERLLSQGNENGQQYQKLSEQIARASQRLYKEILKTEGHLTKHLNNPKNKKALLACKVRERQQRQPRHLHQQEQQPPDQTEETSPDQQKAAADAAMDELLKEDEQEKQRAQKKAEKAQKKKTTQMTKAADADAQIPSVSPPEGGRHSPEPEPEVDSEPELESETEMDLELLLPQSKRRPAVKHPGHSKTRTDIPRGGDSYDAVSTEAPRDGCLFSCAADVGRAEPVAIRLPPSSQPFDLSSLREEQLEDA